MPSAVIPADAGIQMSLNSLDSGSLPTSVGVRRNDVQMM